MGCECSGDELTGKVDFQYAVKVVCGTLSPQNNPLPRGQYFTAVNVHNPSRCDVVCFRWKVAVAEPLRPQATLHRDSSSPEPDDGVDVNEALDAPADSEHFDARAPAPGTVSIFADVCLGPDEAIEIDCPSITDLLARSGIKKVFVKGWAVLESPAPLDVVAVYGAAPSADGPISTFSTERVQPRCLPVCEDFDLDCSTGIASWYVAGPFVGPAPASAQFVPAALRAPDTNWATPTGAVWVCPPSTNEGDYTYRLIFKLCSGFRKPVLNVSVLADYFANVYLNNTLVPPQQSAGPGYSSPLVHPLYSNSFRAGQNELTVVVHNSEQSSTGLALKGSIEVAAGLCPGQAMPTIACPEVCYQVFTRHFFWQNDGGWWSAPACNGAEAGTTGQHRRVQAIKVFTSGFVHPGVAVEYRAFRQNYGWTGWTPEGQVCGVTTGHIPIKAVQIRFVVKPPCCSVAYQVHSKKDVFNGGGGWGPWVYDGQTAGTTSEKKRVEAIKVEIVRTC